MGYIKYTQQLVDEREDLIAAYGYGSSFFHQEGYTNKTKTSLDILFVVKDIKKWHKKNFSLNKKDYTKYTKAIFKLAPKSFLTQGTSLSYNIVFNKYPIDFKYGLIEESSLINNLLTWDKFYVCGRMQKPLYPFKKCDRIEEANAYNRKSALLISLLILDKDIITIDELLTTICGLSYIGDIRTSFIENKNKINNIVSGSKKLLEDIYLNSPYMKKEDKFLFVNMYQVYNDINLLPQFVLNKFNKKRVKYNSTSKCFIDILGHKNKKESILHPTKQIVVTGFNVSEQYIKEKIKKKKI